MLARAGWKDGQIKSVAGLSHVWLSMETLGLNQHSLILQMVYNCPLLYCKSRVSPWWIIMWREKVHYYIW